jgi:hypothetical protein
MKALPSIAFNDFSGSAKDVTARSTSGGTILSVRSYPSKVYSPNQKIQRNNLSKISRAYKQLTDSQMKSWEGLAKHLKATSYLGSSAEMTAHNAFVRININRSLAGEHLLKDAPSHIGLIPDVAYSSVVMTPQMIMFSGIKHESAPYKLVVKMSTSQSAGISNGWSKTVLLASDIEDDWGEADVTRLYLKVIGVEPVPGQKVFIEAYWMNTQTGIGGQVFKDSLLVTGESTYKPRMRVTEANLDPAQEQSVSAIDVDYSTNAPVVNFNAVCLGYSNVAASKAYLDEKLPSELLGISYALGRGMGEDGSIHPQSYQIQSTNFSRKTSINFNHRGGAYIKPTEVFGPGIFYQQ